MSDAQVRAVHACPHCGDPFARADYLALHVGREHPGTITAAERAAFERALAQEEAWLERFGRHVRGALVALPVVVTYLLIILMLHLSGIGYGWGFLLLPGVAAFAGMGYYLAYTHEKPSEVPVQPLQRDDL